MRADEPAPGAVSARLTGLHLEHEQSGVGVHDDEIRLTVVRGTVTTRPRDEADVRIEACIRGERLAKHPLDVALGVCPHSYPQTVRMFP
jgi:hypothetical protein